MTLGEVLKMPIILDVRVWGRALFQLDVGVGGLNVARNRLDH